MNDTQQSIYDAAANYMNPNAAAPNPYPIMSTLTDEMARTVAMAKDNIILDILSMYDIDFRRGDDPKALYKELNDKGYMLIENPLPGGNGSEIKLAKILETRKFKVSFNLKTDENYSGEHQDQKSTDISNIPFLIKY